MTLIPASHQPHWTQEEIYSQAPTIGKRVTLPSITATCSMGVTRRHMRRGHTSAPHDPPVSEILTAIIARLLATAAIASLPAASLGQTSPATTDATTRERTFDTQGSSAEQLGWLKDMSSAPNHVGSSHNRANAECS